MAVEPSSPVLTSILLGLAVHQVFRNFETYSISTHAALLTLPPLVTAIFSAPPGPPFEHALKVSFVVYLATLVLAILVYRVSPLHPLARYPGPLGCKLTKFWMGVISTRGYQHMYIKSLHDQYGSVVRIGPNELSILDASVVSKLYGNSGVPKGPHYIGRVLSDTNLPMVGLMDTDAHLRRRRNWTRGMGPIAIKGYEELISKRVNQLLSRLEDQKGQAVIMGHWFNFFSYDFMCEMAFGGGSELLTAGKDEKKTWKVLDDAMAIATFFGHAPWLAIYVAKIPGATGNFKIFLDYCISFTMTRLKRGSEHKDLFHYLNNEDLPDKPSPPVQQLVDDGVLAIVAGADTTASALTMFVFCLLEHPEVYEKLQREIDKHYPAGEDATDVKNHRELLYLTACINETLRVFPSVPGGSQRQVPIDGPGVVAGDLVLPPGTMFWCHIYSHHMSPANFAPHTTDFWRERWLLASGELAEARGVRNADLVHNESGFLPFSAGPMNCVGKALAMQEMRTVVVALLQRFVLKKGASWDAVRVRRDYKDYFTAPRPEFPVEVHARKQ
ncbi:high nitrogen upregulated cytochrome P450 monooxygenase 2 [Epithele typhae]|uniref:high nitrogen upregulated cytochrome P450 monooxygenase 2 n=1 Tax=Epithele typhae TaxID=378194 RepID=UPI0020081D74|nr:high nitrogen upregulated cytochrome P450 monooxygenase 2 [Epithele typhae]KAH9937927.1 high nitrogen upregulated cytochrome P450 monooxygenase 2 [Epithele typhae]